MSELSGERRTEAPLGNVDRVFEQFRNAIDRDYDDLVKMRREPVFKPLRKDARFRALFKTPAA